LIIVLAELPLDAFEFRRQFFICRQNLAQSDECPHDSDVHLDGPIAVEHTGKHGNALFGKGVGQVLYVLASFQGHNL